MTAGRPLEYNPEIALNAAMLLFWRKGYESTSLQDLLKTMGLSKSSFYQAFKSKHQLFQQSIQHYRKVLSEDLETQIRQADSSRQFIENLFYSVASETSGPNARRGCILMNTANEFAQTDTEIADLIGDSIQQVTTIFERAILQAQNENQISKDKDARSLATYLVSTMSGLKNMVKAGADRETIKRIVDIALSALD